jgi:hypothetical protein
MRYSLFNNIGELGKYCNSSAFFYLIVAMVYSNVCMYVLPLVKRPHSVNTVSLSLSTLSSKQCVMYVLPLVKRPHSVNTVSLSSATLSLQAMCDVGVTTRQSQ